MTDIGSLNGEISASLQHGSRLTANVQQAINTLKAEPSSQSLSSNKEAIGESEARDAANKFEALLIHNMLKSMRKTTLAENDSNAKALYNDMLDQRLADTMIQAGGIGIADQIVAQIREQQGTKTETSRHPDNQNRLRELAVNIQHASSADTVKMSAERQIPQPATKTAQLTMATSLWSDEASSTLGKLEQEFIQPLLPHVQRNAARLGTSPAAILAIAALETGWGRAHIKDRNGTDSNNLFGIKAVASDNRYATTTTTEYIEGSPQKLDARFKTFSSKADAVDGFAEFLLSNPRYSKALQHAGDPERFVVELQDAGYATDPRYAEKVISLMRKITGETLSR